MDRVLVALDVSTAAEAATLSDQLRGVVAGFKIGSQLFTAEGPAVVRPLVEGGDHVFLDLKFHDIPNTVEQAVAAATRLGVWMVNVHASGGRAMMEAARRAADRTRSPRGHPPLVVAVTMLTSLDQATMASVGLCASPLEQVRALARLAQESGLDGVVASPLEVAAIRDACGPKFVVVTPGIRGGAADASPDDQARTSTAAGAIQNGSSYLVVGRPITAAADPRAAAVAINREIDGS
jgi:orotidine-5'-phosphate decarboxylase